MAKLEELMKNEEFFDKMEAVADDDAAFDALLKENGVNASGELSEEELADVSGGSISAFLILVAGISTMAANNVTPTVVKDATIINGAYALYKLTGKKKYINSKTVTNATNRMKKWSSKNNLNWNDLFNVVTAG